MTRLHTQHSSIVACPWTSKRLLNACLHRAASLDVLIHACQSVHTHLHPPQNNSGPGKWMALGRRGGAQGRFLRKNIHSMLS